MRFDSKEDRSHQNKSKINYKTNDERQNEKDIRETYLKYVAKENQYSTYDTECILLLYERIKKNDLPIVRETKS